MTAEEIEKLRKFVKSKITNDPDYAHLPSARAAKEALAIIEKLPGLLEELQMLCKSDDFNARAAEGQKKRAEAAERERDDYRDAARSEAQRVNELTKENKDLRADLAQAREALRPFAEMGRIISEGIGGACADAGRMRLAAHSRSGVRAVEKHDFIRARAALASEGDDAP